MPRVSDKVRLFRSLPSSRPSQVTRFFFNFQIAILTFEEARRADRDNERYPTPEPERPASPQAGPQDQKTLTGSLKRAPSLKSVQNLKREKLVNDDEQLEAAIEYMDLDAEAQSGERFD